MLIDRKVQDSKLICIDMPVSLHNILPGACREFHLHLIADYDGVPEISNLHFRTTKSKSSHEGESDFCVSFA